MMKTLKILPIALLLFGCSGSEKTEFIDSSETTEQAIENGAPSPDREWTHMEYSKFLEYLQKLPVQTSLPMFSSAKSGVLFRKYVDCVEMPITRNQNLDIDSRMNAKLIQLDALNKAGQLYLNRQLNGDGDYSTEIAYYMGVLITAGREIIHLANEFLSTLDESDPSYSVRMEGFRQMKSGLQTTFGGFLTGIEKDLIYDSADYEILATYLSEHGAFYLDQFDGTVRKEFEVQIRNLSEKHSSDSIRRAAEGLLMH